MDIREAFYDAIIDGETPVAGQIRETCIRQMQEALPNKPELWDELTPKYNPGCKRVLITDDYYPALARDNVRLETRPISHINKGGIAVASGDEEEYDLIVCATGFKTLEFMYPIEILGKRGRALGDIWKTGAQALNGVVVEDLPNFAMLYGPNTNLGHNSIILMIEAQSRYINALIAPVLEARKQGKALSLSPKKECVEKYNNEVQAVLKNSSFADPACNSWSVAFQSVFLVPGLSVDKLRRYKNEAGLITNNWSGTVVEYQKGLAQVTWDEYEVEGSGQDLLFGRKKTKIGRVVEESRVSDSTIAILGAVSAAALGAGWLANRTKFLSTLQAR